MASRSVVIYRSLMHAGVRSRARRVSLNTSTCSWGCSKKGQRKDRSCEFPFPSSCYDREAIWTQSLEIRLFRKYSGCVRVAIYSSLCWYLFVTWRHTVRGWASDQQVFECGVDRLSPIFHLQRFRPCYCNRSRHVRCRTGSCERLRSLRCFFHIGSRLHRLEEERQMPAISRQSKLRTVQKVRRGCC